MRKDKQMTREQAKQDKAHASIRAVGRALDVLLTFRDIGPELNLGQISEAICLPKSTTWRLLSTMELHRFVVYNSLTQNYRLGIPLFHLGSIVLEGMDLVRIAQPVLDRLRDKTGETATLSIRDHRDRVTIAIAESRHSLRQYTSVGSRIELQSSSSGRVLLAGLPDEQVRAILTLDPLKALSPKTAGTVPNLLSELDEIRHQGYALSRAGRLAGAFSISAPIFDQAGQVLASITVSGPLTRLDERDLELITAVVTATDDVSQAMGFRKR